MHRSVTLVLSTCVSVAAAAQSGAGPYQRGIDVLDYAITIDVPDTGNVIRGDAMLTVRRTLGVDTLTLDLRALGVEQVSVDRRTTRFARTDSTLLVPLPRGDSGTFIVRVVYGGAVTDGLIARQDTLGRWTYFADNWPNRARYWIPSVDHPSDKATVTWTVRAPTNRTIVANGTLMESRTYKRGGRTRRLSRWRESRPISPYLMVIAAAPLVKVDLGQTACGRAELQRCVPQSVYTAPEQRGVVPGPFAHAGAMVSYFASLVGPYPYEKLAHLQSATRFGGMENATAIFYGDALFKRGTIGEGVIAHETAHQWFGDAVTESDWPHLWLSEGFATYFEALWTQHAHGDSAFKAEMVTNRERILADTTAVPHRPVIDTIETSLLALLNRNSYEKGGFVLHMLRAELGDDDFFKGLRGYYAAHKHGNADTDDLQAALEQVSGRPLGVFFDQWLRRPGYPELAVAWTQDSGSHHVNLTVTQSGSFGYFAFPLGIAFTDVIGQRRYYEVSILARAANEIGIDYYGDSIASVTLDPDVKLLARFLPDSIPSDEVPKGQPRR